VLGFMFFEDKALRYLERHPSPRLNTAPSSYANGSQRRDALSGRASSSAPPIPPINQPQLVPTDSLWILTTVPGAKAFLNTLVHSRPHHVTGQTY
jgi:hypothetical protein